MIDQTTERQLAEAIRDLGKRIRAIDVVNHTSSTVAVGNSTQRLSTVGSHIGAQWFDTTDLSLYMWDGASWVLIGGTLVTAPIDASFLTLSLSGDLNNERVFTVGAGLVGTDAGAGSTYTLDLGTPSTLSVSTTDSASGTTHTHAITSSSDPGASAYILATDVNGYLQLRALGIGTIPVAGDTIEVRDGFVIGITGNATITFDSSGYVDINAVNATVGSVAPLHTSRFEVYDNSSQLGLYYGADTTKYVLWEVGSTGASAIRTVSDLVFWGSTTGLAYRPNSPYTFDLGAYNYKWRTLYAAELYVETLVAQYVMATIGGRIMVAPTSKLTASLNVAVTTMVVNDNLFAVNDYAMLESAPGGIAQFEIVQVTAGPTGGAGSYSYTVTRDVDGSGQNQWDVGDAIVNLGYNIGDGYIDITSTQTVHAALGPTITMYVRATAGAPWNNAKPVVTLGNLDSFLGYGTEFGMAIGNDVSLASPTSSSFRGLTADTTNGIRLFNTDLQLYDSSTPKVQLLHGEGILLSSGTWGATTTTFAAVFTDDATVTSLDANDVIIGQPFHTTAGSVRGIHWDNSIPRLYVYATSNTYMMYESTGFYMYGNGTQLFQMLATGNFMVGNNSAGHANMLWNASSSVLQLRVATSTTIELDASTGDATFGQVTTGKANMFWDSSAGRLNFRGGTSGTQVRAYVDTDGTVVAGSGNVKLDDTGIWISVPTSDTTSDYIYWYQSSTEKMKFGYSDDTINGRNAVLTVQDTNFSIATAGAYAVSISNNTYATASFSSTGITLTPNTGDVYTVGWTDYSATSTIIGWTSYTTKKIYYKRIGKMVFVKYHLLGTSISTSTSFTVPVISYADGFQYIIPCRVVDNGGAKAVGQATLPNGGNVVTFYSDMNASAWTASGTKEVVGEFWYQAA